MGEQTLSGKSAVVTGGSRGIGRAVVERLAHDGATVAFGYARNAEAGTPGSTLARRLAVVQDRLRDALDTAPPGRLRVVSLCAGQGRDLLEVLAHHPRRDDVTARLVELDVRNATKATHAAGYDQLGRSR